MFFFWFFVFSKYRIDLLQNIQFKYNDSFITGAASCLLIKKIISLDKFGSSHKFISKEKLHGYACRQITKQPLPRKFNPFQFLQFNIFHLCAEECTMPEFHVKNHSEADNTVDLLSFIQD